MVIPESEALKRSISDALMRGRADAVMARLACNNSGWLNYTACIDRKDYAPEHRCGPCSAIALIRDLIAIIE